MTYKNHEGYPDPTLGEAVNGVRKEERQRFLEKKHGFKRGQKVDTYEICKPEEHKPAKKRKKTYTVKELYPHYILLENERGQKICPPYTKLREMMQKD